MKVLRSVNRRNFSVEPAGYFNVLTPSKRFTASHPRGEFSYLPGQSKGTAATAPSLELISAPDQSVPGNRRLLRPAMVVLGATALTLFFLWWSTGFPTHPF
jgi:hypothetical protein